MHASGQVCYLPVTAGALQATRVGGGGDGPAPQTGPAGSAGAPHLEVGGPAYAELHSRALWRGRGRGRFRPVGGHLRPSFPLTRSVQFGERRLLPGPGRADHAPELGVGGGVRGSVGCHEARDWTAVRGLARPLVGSYPKQAAGASPAAVHFLQVVRAAHQRPSMGSAPCSGADGPGGLVPVARVAPRLPTPPAGGCKAGALPCFGRRLGGEGRGWGPDRAAPGARPPGGPAPQWAGERPAAWSASPCGWLRTTCGCCFSAWLCNARGAPFPVCAPVLRR